MLLLSGLVVLVFALAAMLDVDRLIDRFDYALLSGLVNLRVDGVVDFVHDFERVLGSELTVGILRWATILVLLAFKRFRHLCVFLGAILAGGFVTSIIATTFSRARPVGVEILGSWEGSSIPSRPVAAMAATLVGIIYTLVVPGRPRNRAKVVVGVVLGALVLARCYLAIDHPTDAVFGLIFGITIPLVAFRSFTPNDVFPVTYKRGKAAHLDIAGERGAAIRVAVEQQLGLTIVEMEPFGLAGSGGSTPLRIKVAEYPDQYLFAKLYAANHLRADRWYKLGRTLLYGRLEDEATFSTVRRLIQYEDYLLRVMRDSGINVARSFGFVEITPEREYMLVTEFIEGARELLDAEVHDAVIDSGLQLVRRLWDAGIAHRDLKPSNILVRGDDVHVIDVAFGEVRPSPWRQAVDLANMMVALALRSDAERVYDRALRFFSPEEIAEAFAATKGVTLPSQSRSLLRKDGRALVARFRELAPDRPRISIQRWSVRRVALTFGVLLVTLLVLQIAIGNLVGAGLVAPPEMTRASYASVGRAPECDRFMGEMLVLEHQSVPSASLLPCLDAPPLGWSFKGLDVRDGRSTIVLDSDRAGAEAVRATLTAECDTTGATEVPSDEVGARRYEVVETLQGTYSGRRFYVFDGGCVTYDFEFTGEGRTALAEEASLALGFVSQEEVETNYEESSGLDL